MLQNADIPSSKVYTAADIAADPQYLDRGMVKAVADPVHGQAILHSGVVPHVVEAPGVVRWTGPAVGAHTEYVLHTLLGLPQKSA